MTYKVNGTEFLMQPTTGRWMPRTLSDISGDGHPLYPARREFELRFNLQDPADIDQLQTWFVSVGTSGTVVIDLPKFHDPTYTFQSYSGCVLHEPERGAFFAEHVTEVVMMVGSIRV